MIKTSVKLTVIMPLYNQETLFRIGLNSIPARDDIEILVIDDGSDDNSLNEARAYQLSSDKNIIVLSNDKNHGVAYTVNRGLDIARGEYIVLLGSDGDYFVNLEKGMEHLDGTDLIYFPLQINSGAFWNPKDSEGGSVKFMRKEFVGGTRNPLIVNCEDNAFHEELKNKKPSEKYLSSDIMYKHYNYPRVGSLIWQLNNGITKRGEAV